MSGRHQGPCEGVTLDMEEVSCLAVSMCDEHGERCLVREAPSQRPKESPWPSREESPPTRHATT